MRDFSAQQGNRPRDFAALGNSAICLQASVAFVAKSEHFEEPVILKRKLLTYSNGVMNHDNCFR